MQTTNSIFLVRPASFSYNTQTALSNTFQEQVVSKSDIKQQIVLKEFDTFVQKLIAAGIDVQVFEDSPSPPKPDAIFPNNWISVHADKTMVLYPMCTENRRIERREDIIEKITTDSNIKKQIDLTFFEKEGRFLEGTGSIVFDHINRIAYACFSVRTDKNIFEDLCQKLDYKAVGFNAFDNQGVKIYHTNVMMSIGKGFAVICLECIADKNEKNIIRESLINSNLEIIEISFAQVINFAGNMLSLAANSSQIIVLSQRAFDCLSVSQLTKLKNHGVLLPVSIPVIETTGGGSARCMICELF